MPQRTFLFLILAVMLAAGVTVAVAASLPGFSYAWLVLPVALALGLRLWLSHQSPD